MNCFALAAVSSNTLFAIVGLMTMVGLLLHARQLRRERKWEASETQRRIRESQGARDRVRKELGFK